MPLAGDQHPVQALAASAAHPALRDCVRPRRLDRRLDDPHADRGEHRIEPNGELRIPVTDQEFQAVEKRPTDRPESAWHRPHTLTPCSWMSGCPAWTESRPPSQLPPARSARSVSSPPSIWTSTSLPAKAGASGFLLKDPPPAELLTAIRTVSGGDAVLAPPQRDGSLNQFAPLLPDPDRHHDALPSKLTDREQTVFAQFAARTIQPRRRRPR